jgi:hypothetical protein
MKGKRIGQIVLALGLIVAFVYITRPRAIYQDSSDIVNLA